MARPVCDTRVVIGIKSIRGGGALNADRSFVLVNDEESPGADMVYGTDGAGVKGWVSISPASVDLSALQASILALELRVSALEASSAPVVVIAGLSYSVASNVTMVEASVAAITITLPSPLIGANIGRLITVKNLSGGDITVSCTEPIDSATSWTLADGEAMTLRSDGVVWCVV